MGDSDEDATTRLTEREAQANLQAVLQLCAAGKLRCSEKTKRPSAATVGAVASNLVDGDFYPEEPIAGFAWPLLLQAGGLATLAGGRLQLTAKGRAALGKPPAETIRLLWQRWISHGVIDEFSRIEEIKGQRATNVLSAVKTRRQTVASALGFCDPGEWIGIDALFTTMRRNRLHPTVARSERGLWKLYLEDPQYGSLGYDGFHKWEILEGRYTLVVLFEYAGTLGLIDLEYIDPVGARDDFHQNWGADELDSLSRYDGLQSIRLNTLGSYAIGLTKDYQSPADTSASQTLKVLPNLDIVATGDLSPSDRLLLDTYAQQTSDRVWALSAATLLEAIDTGRSFEEFIGFLKNRAENELPDAVETLFSDVRDRARQVRDLGPLRVVECADRAVAALIANDRKLRTLCTPIGDRHLAIRLDQEAAFRKALLKLGYVMS